MAFIPSLNTSSLQIHKFPQYTYIDAIRWLPHLSTFTRHILLAAYDAETSTPSLQTLTLSPSQNTPFLALGASISAPSRIASFIISRSPLTPSKPLIAAATFSGSVLFYSADLINESLDYEFSVPEKGFHSGVISGIDLSENGSECVSVGEDGRVNLINLSAKGSFRRLFDSNGLVSYSSIKWASPVEFVTGAFGFGLHWWDQRKAGGPVALFKNICKICILSSYRYPTRCALFFLSSAVVMLFSPQKLQTRPTTPVDQRTGGTAPGIVHCIDIHPSRKHTCLAGGSSGVVFAWDIRWPKQPVMLSGVGDATANSLVESDIWEVQYDNHTYSSKITNSSSSSRILPAMICSEDGILAVIEQGEEPRELLAEPCAINSFDIDRQNSSDVICSLEWESIAILMRP